MGPPAIDSGTARSPASRRGGEQKAARRDAIVQCRSCGCQGTGRISAAGMLTTISVAAYREDGAWRHNRCGGTFAVFDTANRR